MSSFSAQTSNRPGYIATKAKVEFIASIDTEKVDTKRFEHASTLFDREKLPDIWSMRLLMLVLEPWYHVGPTCNLGTFNVPVGNLDGQDCVIILPDAGEKARVGQYLEAGDFTDERDNDNLINRPACFARCPCWFTNTSNKPDSHTNKDSGSPTPHALCVGEI
jgi:hypothetical protein